MLPSRQSTCFQRMPASSSWMQIGVRQGQGTAPAVVHHRVEIADLPQAIAAVLERIGEHADAVLADVEGIAVEVGRSRVAVRHHHVGDGSPVQDRARTALILIGHGVDHEALAGREADPQPPLLPRQLMASKLEARAFRLVNLDRLEAGALARRRRRVVGVLRGQRHDATVLDREHLHLVEVHDRHHVGDRPGIAIVVGTAPHPRERANEPAAFVLGKSEVARRPRVHHRQIEVGHAALLHRRLPAGVRTNRRLALDELVEHERGLHAGHVLPGEHAALGQGDHRLVRAARRAVHEHDERGSLDLVARPMAEHDLLRGLVEHDEDHPRARAGGPLRSHDLPCALDLTCRQGVERVEARDRIGRSR